MNFQRNAVHRPDLPLGLAEYALICGVDLHQIADFEEGHDGNDYTGFNPL
jgi:hypothetical protein